jgi:hypothetical protein
LKASKASGYRFQVRAFVAHPGHAFAPPSPRLAGEGLARLGDAKVCGTPLPEPNLKPVA